MIVAVPVPFAVIFALLAVVLATVATLVFELDQLNPHAYEPLFVLCDTMNVSPLPSVRPKLLNLTLVGAGFTVTLQVAVLPFDVFTVIFAVPAFLAVTLPLLLTDATEELLLDQVQV